MARKCAICGYELNGKGLAVAQGCLDEYKKTWEQVSAIIAEFDSVEECVRLAREAKSEISEEIMGDMLLDAMHKIDDSRVVSPQPSEEGNGSN